MVENMIANLIKDIRSDAKKLVETLTALNNHLSDLEKFTKSVGELTKEIKEMNENIRLLMSIIKELK